MTGVQTCALPIWNGDSGGAMLAIRKIQWLISLSVLIYGVALFGGLGVTAIIFVGVGLVYCALAFWASRLTILPLSTTVVADSMLA